MESHFDPDKEVECLLTENLTCIGHIRYGEMNIYIGPVSTIKCDVFRIRNLMKTYQVPRERLDSFMRYFQMAGSMQIGHFVDITALVCYIFTGNSVDPASLITYASDFDKVNETNNEETVFTPHETEHNAKDLELKLFSGILFGNPIEKAFDPSHTVGINEGTLSFSPINHRRNMMISSVALAARYAVSAGMDYSLSMSIADGYIQLLDRTSDTVKILQIGNDMFRTYSSMVANIRLNHPESLTVYKVQRFITAHINEQITVESIAKAMGISRTYLSAHFKKATDINLKDYICDKKIEQAKLLLRESNACIGDIAAQLAFSSQSHFQTVFKIKTGMTPKEYQQTELSPFEL